MSSGHFRSSQLVTRAVSDSGIRTHSLLFSLRIFNLTPTSVLYLLADGWGHGWVGEQG